MGIFLKRNEQLRDRCKQISAHFSGLENINQGNIFVSKSISGPKEESDWKHPFNERFFNYDMLFQF